MASGAAESDRSVGRLDQPVGRPGMTREGSRNGAHVDGYDSHDGPNVSLDGPNVSLDEKPKTACTHIANALISFLDDTRTKFVEALDLFQHYDKHVLGLVRRLLRKQAITLTDDQAPKLVCAGVSRVCLSGALMQEMMECTH